MTVQADLMYVQNSSGKLPVAIVRASESGEGEAGIGHWSDGNAWSSLSSWILLSGDPLSAA